MSLDGPTNRIAFFLHVKYIISITVNFNKRQKRNEKQNKITKKIIEIYQIGAEIYCNQSNIEAKKKKKKIAKLNGK